MPSATSTPPEGKTDDKVAKTSHVTQVVDIQTSTQPKMQVVVPLQAEMPVIEEEKIDFTKVDKTQYELMVQRLKNYTEAAEYFANNGLVKKAEQFAKTADRFRAYIGVLKMGKKLDLIKIEPPLTPEVFHGQETAARIQLFQAMTEKLQAQLNTDKAAAKECIEKSKKVKTGKATAERYVKKAEEAARMLAQVKEIMKNPWQPCPSWHMDTIQEQKEITQEDVQLREVVFETVPNPQAAAKSDLKLEYVVSTKEETFKGTIDAHVAARVQLPFVKSIKHIERAEAALSLTSSSMLVFSKTHATLQVKLDKFASQTKIPVELTDTSKQLKLQILFKVHAPTKSKEVLTTERKELVIDMIYPAFRSKDVPRTQAAARGPPAKKQAQAPGEEQKRSSESQVHTAGKDPALPEKLPNVPRGIREVDVRDPDDAGNLVCVTYLERKVASFTAAVKTISERGGKIPEGLHAKLNLMTKQHAILNAQIESGKLPAPVYKKYLETQLAKDQTLYTYLKQLKQESKMNIVKERIICVQKELQSFSH
jgi:hypothetical protein